MSTVICTKCGGVKRVLGTSSGTQPMIEATQVKHWCACHPDPDWWSNTFAPPIFITEKDVELARLRAELEQAKRDNDHMRTSYEVALQNTIESRCDTERAAGELRAELTEARADVARFEAALDVANRELAEARRERDFAQEGEENLRHLKKMWEQECGYYVGLWREKSHECSRHRSTIRALVVAFRDALHLTRRVASDETWDMWLQLVQRQAAERREADRQAGKE